MKQVKQTVGALLAVLTLTLAARLSVSAGAEAAIAKGISDNQAAVGDTVTCTVTVTVPACDPDAAVAFSVSDRLPEGLTFGRTVSVRTTEGTAVSCAGGDGPRWSFAPRDVKGVTALVITYTAEVNGNILIGDANIGTATLTCDPGGTDAVSLSAAAALYSYGLQVLAVDAEQPGRTLAGAAFDVYLADGVTRAGRIETGADGIGRLTGLDAGTCYLQQTEAAAGYAPADGRIKVEIPDRSNGTPVPGGIKKVTVRAARLTRAAGGRPGAPIRTAAFAALLTPVLMAAAGKRRGSRRPHAAGKKEGNEPCVSGRRGARRPRPARGERKAAGGGGTPARRRKRRSAAGNGGLPKLTGGGARRRPEALPGREPETRKKDKKTAVP